MMKMKFYTKLFIISVLLFGLPLLLQAQKSTEQLIEESKGVPDDTTKVRLLNQIAFRLCASDPQKAAGYVAEALELAQQLDDNKGIAFAYHINGNIAFYTHDFETALAAYFESLELRQRINDTPGMASTTNNIANIYMEIGQYEKALQYHVQSLELNIKLHDKYWTAHSYYNVGNVHEKLGNYPQALEYFLNSLEQFQAIDDKQGIAFCYNSIGNVYRHQGDFDRATENYYKSLTISDKNNDRQAIATAYNNIGIIANIQGNYNEALDYFFKSLEIKEVQDDIKGIGDTYNNIGLVYLQLGETDSINFQKALDYYQRSLEKQKLLGSQTGIATAYDNIGVVYISLNQYEIALEYYQKSLEIRQQLKEKRGIASSFNGVAECYTKMQQHEKAIDYYTKGYSLGTEIGMTEIVQEAAKGLSDIYAAQNQFEKAYFYHVIFKQMTDTLRNAENTRYITQLSMQYQFDKKLKAKELEQQKRELQQAAELNRQKIYRNVFLAAFVLMLSFAFVIYRGFRIKKRDNRLLAEQKEVIQEKNNILENQKEEITEKNAELEQQKEEILAQTEYLQEANAAILKQKEEIEGKNRDITASINYASRIQNALLPPKKQFSGFLPESFILYKPRDIVSGDYYWVKKIRNYVIVAAADCTGHGVPGAMMSMLAISLMNEIAAKLSRNYTQIDITANTILNELRDLVKKSLRQTGRDNEAKDGLDIALCIINFDDMTLQFSGAYNSLYLIRNNELFQYKADRMPIGIFLREKATFTNYSFPLKKDDTLYMFSDGFVDQLGGPEGRKFKIRPFKDLLMRIHHQPMAEQEQILDTTFEEWRGNHPQIDDVLVVGIKI